MNSRQPIAGYGPTFRKTVPDMASWSSRPCSVAGAPSLIFIRTPQHIRLRRATHIQCCPGPPRISFAAHRTFRPTELEARPRLALLAFCVMSETVSMVTHFFTIVKARLIHLVLGRALRSRCERLKSPSHCATVSGGRCPGGSPRVLVTTWRAIKFIRRISTGW